MIVSAAKYNLVLSRPGYAELLHTELKDRWNLDGEIQGDAAVALRESTKMPKLDDTVFGRQVLLTAQSFEGTDQKAVVEFVIKRLEVMSLRANRVTGRWTLHVFSMDDDEATQRASKLEKAVMTAIKEKLSRLAKRYVDAEELVKEAPQSSDFLIQIYVPSLDKIWLSTAGFSSGVSPYIAGNLRMRDRAGAPSRSARKLEEAFVAMNIFPKAGETAVDLGAAPGGWTFALARHGAKVTAVDHGELDLPEGKSWKEKVNHLRENGLKYEPLAPVDWLCCDMLIGSRETLRVLGEWLDKKLTRRFVVNVKLPQTHPWPVIKEALALLEKYDWKVLKARHLYHDRREITLMGSRDGD